MTRCKPEHWVELCFTEAGRATNGYGKREKKTKEGAIKTLWC